MAAPAAAASVVPLEQRPLKDTICLFDVDGTLTPARRPVAPEMLTLLAQLRNKCAIGFVGGSDLVKQQEQLGSKVTSMFDYCFAENGLTAYRLGEKLASASFIDWIGDEKYKEVVNWLLVYIAGLDIPVKRGTFVEFRNGMINVSPVGRNASIKERGDYEKYDIANNIRPTMIKAMKEKFPELALTYSIGGQISFDVFPTGWDKTYCLRHVEAEKGISGIEFKTIHFFGDKAYPGGNDWEIYEDKRTTGHKVTSPEDTMNALKEIFAL